MKKRLLVVSTMYPSERYPSFGIFVKNQVDQIKQKGYQVDLVVIKNPKMGKINLIAKYTSWFLRWMFLSIKNYRKYDIIHAHYVFPSGFLGLVMKKLSKKPLIVTVHGGDIDKMARKNRVINYWTKNILQQANHVIAVGEKLEKQLIQEFEVREEKLSILNMGVDRSVFYPVAKSEIRQQMNLPVEDNIILFVGNIIQAKGVKELLVAYQQLTKERFSLYIIGEPKEPSFYHEMVTYMEDHQLKNIQLLPPLSQKKIANWMNAADVLIVPSYMEGFGLVALEAMACHTPVIGSDVGGLKYLLAESAGIAVQPRNATALQQNIEKVINDHALKEQLVANGEKKATLYDKDNIMEQLLTIYQVAERP